MATTNVVGGMGNGVAEAIAAQQSALQGYMAGMAQLNDGFKTFNQTMQNKKIFEENQIQFRVEKNVESLKETWKNPRIAANTVAGAELLIDNYMMAGKSREEATRLVKDIATMVFPEDMELMDMTKWWADPEAATAGVVEVREQQAALDALKQGSQIFEEAPVTTGQADRPKVEGTASGPEIIKLPPVTLHLYNPKNLEPNIDDADMFFKEFNSFYKPYAPEKLREDWLNQMEVLGAKPLTVEEETKLKDDLQVLRESIVNNVEVFLRENRGITPEHYSEGETRLRDNLVEETFQWLTDRSKTEPATGQYTENKWENQRRGNIQRTEGSASQGVQIQTAAGNPIDVSAAISPEGEGVVAIEKQAQAEGQTPREAKATGYYAITTEAVKRLDELGITATEGKVTAEQFDAWSEQLLEDAGISAGQLRQRAAALRDTTRVTFEQSNTYQAFQSRIRSGVYARGGDLTARLRQGTMSDEEKRIEEIARQYDTTREDAARLSSTQMELQLLISQGEAFSTAIKTNMDLLQTIMNKTEFIDEPEKLFTNQMFLGIWESLQGLTAFQLGLPTVTAGIDVTGWFGRVKKHVDYSLIAYGQNLNAMRARSDAIGTQLTNLSESQKQIQGQLSNEYNQ